MLGQRASSSPSDLRAGGMRPWRTTRRGFVGGVTAAVAGLLAGCRGRPRTAGGEPLPPPEQFPRRRLGKNGPLVPILQQGGDYTYSPRLVKRSMDLGVRSFDSAETYANKQGEVSMGRCFAKLKLERKDYFLATKGRPKRPADVLGKHLPRSLERLQADYVDLWYLHDVSDPGMLADPAWRSAAAGAKQSGKTRLVGLTCHNARSIDVMKAAARCGWIDAIMFRYNFRSYGDKALDEAIGDCHQAGIGLIAMKTQASAVSFAERVNPFKEQGYSKHQAVLKAVWQDERITAIVSAMPAVTMLEQNAAAAYDRLSTAEARLLRDYATATASAYCPGGCGGCRRECEAALDTPLAVADLLRLLMYHDSYGRPLDARRLLTELSPEQRCLDGADLARAEGACPNALPLTRLVPHALARLG